MYIVLAGCSWACGEWGLKKHTRYQVKHPGLSRYLQEAGHMVQITAVQGSDNLTQLALAHEQARPDGRVVFVQTDPVRSYYPTVARSHPEFHQQWDHHLQRLYQGLAELPCPTVLVGGNAPVRPALVPGGSQVQVAVEDWVQALVGHRPAATFSRMWSYPDCDRQLLAEWEQEEHQLAEWDRQCRVPGTPEHEWFWPDGRHPNRQAHRWLADLLLADHIR